MKALTALLIVVLSLCSTPARATEYHFDKEHTTILFFINHLGFSDKIGRFIDYDGTLLLDEKNPEKSRIDVVIHPAGIRTDSAKLDEELQKKDWFNTATYPDITFRSTKIEREGDKKARVSGWVKMLGEEKFVTLDVTFNKEGEHLITKNHVAGFSADTHIKRSEFGLINGIPLVGDDVRIHIEAELFRFVDPELSRK